MIDVPVIAPFTHEGRVLRVGETIRVSPLTAAALHRRRLVSLTTGYVAAAPEPAPEPAPVIVAPVRRKRTYRRRDLVAE
ncbi:MAG: hypothetical protein OEW98_00090 [Betaproteobacteria bacterium]|nr:hypothetical protein [Betaproteobacteria bacterium]